MKKRLVCTFALVIMMILVDVTSVQGGFLPDTAYISGLKGHAQSYPLSCESRSAADVAAYWGVNIGETEFLQALPHSDNPEVGFVGSVNDAWGRLPPNGYGVHASPVAETLQAFGFTASGLSNLSWDDLRTQISGGSPVIVWVIGAMWNGTSVEYVTFDGSTARVAAFEHTMILTGYSQDTVQVVDASTGLYYTYPLKVFLQSWAVLGNMAVFASRPEPNQDSPLPESDAESYTVQPGDYLIELAMRFGVSWQELAELNSISYPYYIQAGQVLHLPVRAEQTPGPVQEPAQPAQPEKVVNYMVRLPLVEHDYAVQVAPAVVIYQMAPNGPGQTEEQGSGVLNLLSNDQQAVGKAVEDLHILMVPFLVNASPMQSSK